MNAYFLIIVLTLCTHFVLKKHPLSKQWTAILLILFAYFMANRLAQLMLNESHGNAAVARSRKPYRTEKNNFWSGEPDNKSPGNDIR